MPMGRSWDGVELPFGEWENGERAALANGKQGQGTKKLSGMLSFFLSCGGQTRTDDLRVMSPTSYQLLHPAI